MREEHPFDTLSDGLRCLGAIHDLLVAICDRHDPDLHLINAECLCTLVGVVRYMLEDARDGLHRRGAA